MRAPCRNRSKSHVRYLYRPDSTSDPLHPSDTVERTHRLLKYLVIEKMSSRIPHAPSACCICLSACAFSSGACVSYHTLLSQSMRNIAPIVSSSPDPATCFRNLGDDFHKHTTISMEQGRAAEHLLRAKLQPRPPVTRCVYCAVTSNCTLQLHH